MLIDTGFNRIECREALWCGIHELDLDLKKTSVFLTHFHSDHIGLADDFVKAGCPIYMSKIDYHYLAGLKSRENLSAIEKTYQVEGFPTEDLARQNQENQGRKYGVTQMFPARLVEDGAVLMLGSLQVKCISTPGHTPGHMVLYLPWEQLLFTGDHILFDITPNISIWHQVPHSLEDYLSSLDRIKCLPIRAAFPAHRSGEGNVYLRIDDLKTHHEQRLEEIRQAVEKHPGAAAYQIAGMIKWSARGMAWEQFPPHQKWFAMGETLAHLQYLCDYKEVLRVENTEGVCYVPCYRP